MRLLLFCFLLAGAARAGGFGREEEEKTGGRENIAAI